MELHELSSHLAPNWTGKQDYTIGIVGLGGIVRMAHLPAYRQAGFRVAGGADPTEAARSWAETQGISKTYASAAEMIEKVKPDIVDIAVGWEQPEVKLNLVRTAAEAGCHILIQKPLAGTYAECVRIVECAESNKVKLSVNQNARWGAAQYGSKQLLRALEVGPLRTAMLGIRAKLATPNRVHDLCVHSTDLMRWWFGEEPESVYAGITERDGKQYFVSAILSFAGGRQGCIWDDFDAVAVLEDWQFRLCGEKGSVYGGENFLAMAQRSWLEGASEKTAAARVRLDPLPYAYVPNAFVHTMADLMDAIDKDRLPLTHGRDNLKSMALLLAIEQSAKTRKAVRPEEIHSGK